MIAAQPRSCVPDATKYTVQQVICTPLKTYTPEFQAQVLREFEALPKGSALRIIVSDYGVTREDIRRCLALGGTPIELRVDRQP